MKNSLLFCAGLAASLMASGAQAQNSPIMAPRPSKVAPTAPPMVWSAPVPNPHLVELEKRLRPVILAFQPAARIGLDGTNYFHASYGSGKDGSLPFDSGGYLSKQAPAQFPAEFADFSLSLSVEEDVVHYRFSSVENPRGIWTEMPEPQRFLAPKAFGATLTSRADLKLLPAMDRKRMGVLVEPATWPWDELQRLNAAGVLPSPWPASGIRWGDWGMNRYEFALLVLRYLQDVESGKQTPPVDPKLKASLAALTAEFAPDIMELSPDADRIFPPDMKKTIYKGQIWQPRTEHLALRFSYGKGVNVALRDAIEKVVADYAAEVRKTNGFVNP